MRAEVEAVGTRIVYEVSGKGPALVFLHAGIAHRSMWSPQVQYFSGRFRCISPDARGFGDTSIGSEPFSRRDDLAKVLDDADAEKVSIVGCSIGAGFALDFAIENPDRVEKLVLVGVAPAGFDGVDDLEAIYEEVEAAIDAGDLDRAGRLEARAWVDGPRRAEESAPEWLRDQVVEWTKPINQITDWGESLQLDPYAMYRLDQVVAPTLVIVGNEDSEFVISACQATVEGISDAALVELEGTAHLPNLEVSEVFNSTVSAFLE